jgi:hypothetical protein
MARLTCIESRRKFRGGREMADKDLANHRTSAEAPDVLGDDFAQVREDKGDSADDPGPFGPRAAVRRDLRVEIDPKLWKLIGRLRRDLDTSASGLVRAALREMAVKLYGAGALR